MNQKQLRALISDDSSCVDFGSVEVLGPKEPEKKRGLSWVTRPLKQGQIL